MVWEKLKEGLRKLSKKKDMSLEEKKKEAFIMGVEYTVSGLQKMIKNRQVEFKIKKEFKKVKNKSTITL